MLCNACNPRARVELARHAAEDFHNLYNHADYARMYTHTGPAVRSSTTETAFVSYEKDVRAKLGALTSADVSNYNLTYVLSGPQVRLDYQCRFEGGHAFESFEFGFDHGRPVINGYRLDSPKLEDKPGR
jgi:hypothetical protein